MIFLYYFSEEGKIYGPDTHCMKFKQGVEIKLIFFTKLYYSRDRFYHFQLALNYTIFPILIG